MKRESFGTCQWCDELILPGDAVAETNVPMHHECAFRSVAGGARHHLKLCTCCGGKLEPDDPSLTRREAARQSLQWFRWLEELREVMKGFPNGDMQRVREHLAKRPPSSPNKDFHGMRMSKRPPKE